MAKRNETGKDGESVARAFLEKQGYKITHTNWHWHHYELDIVAVQRYLAGCGRGENAFG